MVRKVGNETRGLGSIQGWAVQDIVNYSVSKMMICLGQYKTISEDQAGLYLLPLRVLL